MRRPWRDTPPPLLADLVASLSDTHAAWTSFADQRNSLPSRSMRWRMTESLRATATVAFLVPIRLARRVPQALRRPARDTIEDDPGRLIQVGAQQLVAAAGDVAGVVLLAGLIAPRRQADVGPDAGRLGEALRRIHDADVGERDQDAWSHVIMLISLHHTLLHGSAGWRRELGGVGKRPLPLTSTTDKPGDVCC